MPDHTLRRIVLSMKWIDLPPVWLALFAAVVWIQASYLPFGPSLADPAFSLAGAVLIGAGLLLMALAFVEFRRHRTTVIPHREASVLIRSGIFARTRNPIYLGDTLILLGLVLRWDAFPSFLLVPIFASVITRRFIRPEEERLRRGFGADWARYEAAVRRWL